MAIPGDFGVNRLITDPHPYGTAALIFYVRPAGNDNNSGLSPAAAFATFPRALREMDLYSVDQPVVINVTGMTGADAIEGEYLLNLGGTNLGGISYRRDTSVVPPADLKFSRRHRQIVSDLVLVQALTITGQSNDAETGLLTITVSNTLVADALRGKFLITGTLGEYGAIQGNTGGVGPNTILVACASSIGVTAGAGAYEPGATLNFGEPGESAEGAIYLLALCDWSLQGLFLTSNGKPAALSIWPTAPVDVLFCDVAGIEMNEGSGEVTVECCHLNGETWVQDGATARVFQSYFQSVSFLCHGSGSSGLNELQANIFQGCQPFGGGNVESRYTFEVQQCEWIQSPNEAVIASFGNSRLVNCRARNGSKTAILADGTVFLRLDNVSGTTNTGYGVQLSNGAKVLASSGTDITGTLNDAFVGDLGATTWAAINAAVGNSITDLGQLVRVTST